MDQQNPRGSNSPSESELTSRRSSTATLDSCLSGVLSASAISLDTADQIVQIQETPPSPTRNEQTQQLPLKAQINTESQEFLGNLAPDKLKVHLTSKYTNMSKTNPEQLARAIDDICGQVDSFQPLKSGAIIITCKSTDQVHKLIATKSIKLGQSPNIEIKASIAINSQSCQGRIWAPALANTSLDAALRMLESQGVVEIRKLLNDPAKSDTPAYVLTFFQKSCPDKIKLFYYDYNVTPYIPNPLRCTKCCKIGHTKAICRGTPTCSNCGSKSHTQDTAQCTANKYCINCKEPHSSLSRDCPLYQIEKEICKIKTMQNVSFIEARNIHKNQTINQSSQQNNFSQAR